MQTQQRKIPFRGVNATYKNWWEVLPEFEKGIGATEQAHRFAGDCCACRGVADLGVGSAVALGCGVCGALCGRCPVHARLAIVCLRSSA